MMDVVVGLFAKAPEPGRVKTRLGRDIGMQKAARFYAECLAWIILRLDRSEFNFRLFYTPLDCEDQFMEQYDLLEEVPCHPQEGENLGDRMLNAMRLLEQTQSGPNLIIGSDSPDLPMDYLQRALEALESHDLVFGPARDGGYYLVGMNEPQPVIFKDMEWSHSKVLEESLRRARRASLRTHTLPVWTDYDRAEDLKKKLRTD